MQTSAARFERGIAHCQGNHIVDGLRQYYCMIDLDIETGMQADVAGKGPDYLLIEAVEVQTENLEKS